MVRPRVRRISPVAKEKVYGRNDLPKSQVLGSDRTGCGSVRKT